MKYHILDLKTKKGDVCIWWRSNCAGYTRLLEEAGIYSQAEIDEHPNYFNNGETTKAIPVLQVELFARKYVPVNFMHQMVNYTPDIAVTTSNEAMRRNKISELQQQLKDAEANWLNLEKQYSKSLGRLAELCNFCIPALLQEGSNATVKQAIAAEEIMHYVDSVRP